MQDWLGCGFRKQPFADEAAEFLLPNQVRITPDGEVILLAIQHQRFGKLPLPAERRQRLFCRSAVIENQRGFKTTAHRGGRQRQILLRILFQGKDWRGTQQ